MKRIAVKVILGIALLGALAQVNWSSIVRPAPSQTTAEQARPEANWNS